MTNRRMLVSTAAVLLTFTLGGAPPAQARSSDVGEAVAISLDLKDAALSDVLRYFSEISELNVVVGPGVSGTVTIRLIDVPWDQALETVLRAHGLWYDFDGDVLFVAPMNDIVARLTAEASLAEARDQAEPLHTVMVKLSYANATDVAAIVQATALSERGTILVDQRTNSLIVTDLAHRLSRARLVAHRIDH